jgi:cytochrome b561
MSPISNSHNENSRYTGVAIFLHWTIAAMIVALLCMGFTMLHIAVAPATKTLLFTLHKSIGITVLAAAAFRLIWRLGHRPPPLENMSRLERQGALAVHWLFYVLMFGMPLTGWAVVSASAFNVPTMLYGLVLLPKLPTPSNHDAKAMLHWLLEEVHGYGAYLLIAILILHVAAALRHHIIRRDHVFIRMLPYRLSR